MFKPSQKFRLVIDGHHFYTSAKQIRAGVGDLYRTNAAVQKCLLVLEHSRLVEKFPPVGLAGFWEGCSVQLDMVK